MKPPPPMLPADGWVTASANAVATAASTALPPFASTVAPASHAGAETQTTSPSFDGDAEVRLRARTWRRDEDESNKQQQACAHRVHSVGVAGFSLRPDYGATVYRFSDAGVVVFRSGPRLYLSNQLRR